MEDLPEALTTTIAEPAMDFNPNVHEANEIGDPIRNDDMSLRLKRNWKTVAKDRQGRDYNPHVHGDKVKLDDKGFLKVKRREASSENFSASKTRAFVAKFKEPGYHYYLANDLGGVPEKMLARGYEVVMDGKGAAKMPVGATREEGTMATLYRIPEEWNEANQRKKREMNDEILKEVSSPKAEDGQYQATSPLR